MPDALQVNVTVRAATQEDCRRFWEWRNDPDTRAASLETDYICYEDHARWFSNKLGANDTRMFVILDGRSHEVGYVRLKIIDDSGEVSVSVDPGERGKGYGSAAVRAAADRLLATGEVRRIVAFVKPWNVASVKAFERAGFVRAAVKDHAGVAVWEMVFEGVRKAMVSERR